MHSASSSNPSIDFSPFERKKNDMAASHAFQLTVVNCPSQVRGFLRAPWHAGRERSKSSGMRVKEREREAVFFQPLCLLDDGAPSPLLPPLFFNLNLNLLSSMHEKNNLQQDLAKTNLAFVSAEDPATAYPFLEVNGW